MVVTNLRVPSEEWNQLKAVAAEQGMRGNEYINYLMRSVVVIPIGRKKKGVRMNVWEMPKLAKKAKKPAELSDDDKLIYR